jgi:tetratricopeptide (TPR) repeat protein
MNKAELLKLIRDPQLLDKQQFAALKRMEGDFPYFQSLQVLLAKALANQKHYDFNRQLQKTALSVPDREVLYRYIHDLSANESIEVQPETEFIPSVSESLIVLEEDKTPEKSIIEESKEPVSETKVPETILPETEERTPEIIAVAEPVSVSIPEPEPEIPLTPLVEVPVVPIQEKVSFNEVHTFSEWLKLSIPKEENIESHLIDVTFSVDAEAGEPVSDAPVVFTEQEHEKEKEKEKGKDASNLNDFESILDRFIRESPRISRPKAEFYSPANMAKQSVEEDEDLVTETLAKLYMQQGHYKKAIRAYEKLCLIYPHKMAYFADLIQRIKQENKD